MIGRGSNVTVVAVDDFFVTAANIILSTRTASTDALAQGNYVEIVQDLVDEVTSINPGQITASTAQISTVAAGWETVVYEDRRPGEILDKGFHAAAADELARFRREI
ncbi:MAG: hypothetical protein EBY80_15045, partial [Actinobacteria bacterium]|nr:hypothetical protein [Actinomycetota bacterium]